MGETFKQRERWDGTAGLAAGNAGLGSSRLAPRLGAGTSRPPGSVAIASPCQPAWVQGLTTLVRRAVDGSQGQPKNVGASGYRAPSWIQGLLQAAAGTSDPVDATVVLLAQAGDRIVTGDAGDLPRLAAAAGTGCVLVAC